MPSRWVCHEPADLLGHEKYILPICSARIRAGRDATELRVVTLWQRLLAGDLLYVGFDTRGDNSLHTIAFN